RAWRCREMVLEGSRAIPEVAAAATSNRFPVSANTSNACILDDKWNHPNGASYEDYVSAGYFHSLAIPLLAGRDFNSNDTAGSPRVAIVNQMFVKKFLDGAKNAIGK